MTTIFLNLENCVQLKNSHVIGHGCPYALGEQTTGAGQHAVDYKCSLTNRVTSGYVESYKEINPVPDWCLLLKKDL